MHRTLPDRAFSRSPPRRAVFLAVLASSLACAGTPHARAGPAAPAVACERQPVPLDGSRPGPVCIAAEHFDRDLCSAIRRLAQRQSLPPGFLARLIWRESRFDPDAVSPKGAEGIAQFMPSTARLRGLADSFNPADALAKSAAYLHEMRREFGNLGLAAVGYNAGEERAADLLDLGRPVPVETARYVLDITGLPVSAWTDTGPKPVDFRLDDRKPFLPACLELAEKRTMSPPAAPAAPPKPWGAEIGASFSPVLARRIFQNARAEYPKMLNDETPLYVRQRNLSFGTRPRYTVRIGRDSRDGAQHLCRGITAAGGYCVVRKN